MKTRNAVFAMAAVFIGCSGSTNESGQQAEEQQTESQSCQPGERIACACPAGTMGMQACAADGASFEPCQCDEATNGTGTANGSSTTGGATNSGSTNGGSTNGGTTGATNGGSSTTGGSTNGDSTAGGSTTGGSTNGGTTGATNGGSTGTNGTANNSGTANNGSTGNTGNTTGGVMPPGDLCLQGTSTDFLDEGPYAVTQTDVDLGGNLGPYTIFHPQSLDADCPHPIVAWGNGTTVTGSAVYSHFHRHAASWGIVVIAAHNSNASSQPFLEGGIDHLLSENDNPDSPFYGKLSSRAGTAGHSQGGFAATTAASHPNVVAEVCVQGGGVPPADVAFLCETGVDDFVRPQCTSAYNAAPGPSFLADHSAADHVNTPTPLGASTPAGVEYVRLYTAWFRCFLADDANACALFEGGTSAPVCSQADWATCDGKNF